MHSNICVCVCVCVGYVVHYELFFPLLSFLSCFLCVVIPPYSRVTAVLSKLRTLNHTNCASCKIVSVFTRGCHPGKSRVPPPVCV